MFTWKRLFYASAFVFILFFGFVRLILPGIVIDRAQNWVAAEMNRTLKIGSVSINPIGLTVAVRDLSLSEADQEAPFITWQSLSLSLSSKSLLHMAPIVDDLRLDNPTLHLERLADNKFNFSDLLPETKEEASPEPAGEPAQFSINNLTINNGNIELIDRSLEDEVKHTIQELNLALPSIGNLAYMVENPAQPVLHALVNDSPVDIKGEFLPFTETQEMQFNLALDNIDLPFYLGYVPVELPVQLRNGRLSLDLNVLYRLTDKASPELIVDGHINLASLNIWDRQNEQLFFLPLLQVDIAPSRPLAKDIHLSALRIYNLEVQLQRDPQGVWNHSRLSMAGEQPAEPEPAPDDDDSTPSLKLVVDDIEIRDGVVYFRDDTPAGGFKTTAKEINIDLNNFALDTTAPSPVSLSLETEHKEALKVTGHFLLAPFTLALETELTDLQTAVYAPYYQDVYSVPLEGAMSIQARLDINPEQPLLISQGNMQWREAYMAFNDTEGLGIGPTDISNVSFDLAKNRLEVESAHYENGRMNFSRSKEGLWSLLSSNFPILAKLTETQAGAEPPQPKDNRPEFNYQIGELAMIDWTFDIHDRMPGEPVHLQANDFDLSVRNLAAPEKVQSPFDFSTTFGRKGQVSIKGQVSLAEQTATVNTHLKNISLTTFAPYVSEQTNLVLENGLLNAKLKTAVKPAAEISFAGNIGISRMHLLGSLHHEDLLKWDSLQIAGIDGAVTPLKLSVDSITLSDYFAKFLVDEEGRLNLVEAFNQGEGTEDTTEPGKAEPVTVIAEEPEAQTTPPDIQIAKVVLQGGQIDFTDRHLPQPFHADMWKLGGSIQGLSSSPEARAAVDLRGNLRNQSPLSITGEINPLAEELFVDLELGFRDIELSPFSPYSGTFAGYVIEKGKLHLNLDYFVEDGQLKAGNKVFIDQFTFGDAVVSEQATDLPVKLAVALLKDRNGEIHLDIPVSGNLDDPQFRIGSVIWTVLRNLIVKAATSPLALLGSMIGGGDEDFSSISFDYGSARLTEIEQDKLRRMAEALLDRPSLDIEVKGFIDPEEDPEGYRREQLSQQVKELKYRDLAKREELPEGAKAEDLVLEPEEYADYLWQVYRKTDFPKPRNFVGMTKQLPELEMEKLIYTNTIVTDEELAKLAQARALTVQSFLIEEGKLGRERVFLTKPDIAEAPEEEGKIKARVELGATVQ